MSSYTSQRFRPHRPHYTQFLHEWVSLNGKKQFPSGYLSVNNVTKCFPNNLKDPLLFSCSQNMWYQYKNTQRTKPAHSEACREISFTWLGWNVLGGGTVTWILECKLASVPQPETQSFIFWALLLTLNSMEFQSSLRNAQKKERWCRLQRKQAALRRLTDHRDAPPISPPIITFRTGKDLKADWQSWQTQSWTLCLSTSQSPD